MIASRTGRVGVRAQQNPSTINTRVSDQSKGSNTTMVTQTTQRANCQPATRDKAKALDVETISRREAYVIGATGTYCVEFRSLACSCRAGQFNLRCSHVLAALRERARMEGYAFTAFLPTARHAANYAKMQEGLGRKTKLDVSSQKYYFVSFDTTDINVVLPPDSAVVQAVDVVELPIRPRCPARQFTAAEHVAAQSAADSLY